MQSVLICKIGIDVDESVKYRTDVDAHEIYNGLSN